jgi:hypothetical protein
VKIENILGVVLVYILLNATLSLAQRGEWNIRSILLILGEVPRRCYGGITPECFSCLLYVKFLPLLFFFALFFLIFFYLIHLMVERKPVVSPVTGEAVSLPPTPFEMKVITILSMILSLVLLNAFTIRTILSQFMFWIALMFLALVFLLMRGVAKLGGFGIILGLIFAIILFASLWSFISGLISPVIEGWLRLCA